MSNFIIPSIIAAAFSICFLAFGIYAHTHKKKIIKDNAKSIVDPKYISIGFICFAIASAYIATELYFEDPIFKTDPSVQDFESILNTIAIVASSSVLIAIGSIGLAKKRIIYFKDLPVMKKYNQKFQKVSNILRIALGISWLLAFLGIFNVPFLSDFVVDHPSSMTYILLILAAIGLPLIIIDVYIDSSASSKTKKK